MIEPGSPAPDFTLPDQDGNKVSLADFRGRTVVLVFYPADFSRVCTDQLSVYQEVLPQFEEQGAALLGISVDGAFCHKAFREHLNTTIPLLADFHPKGEVAKAYGVWSEEYGVASRSLVMVGPDGVVQWSYSSPPLEVPGANLIFDALEQRTPA
ncbi:MAG TPA: redoxin domain-containing protein [Thermoleophilaceae bacterium]|nr:redoxin domain-containing protein [Thermoleophilaceae bacterium]